jgi:hypothetical protein
MLELSYGIIWADIVMAKQGIEVYKNNTKLKDIKNMCAYHLQQAVEKLIKIQIYKSGIKYDLHFAVRIDTLEKSLAVVEKWYYQVKKVVK